MRLRRRLPPDRTFDQVRNHYLAEKSIAERLKSSSREERRRIYATMYDELFARVPDHPRLTRRDTARLTEIANRDKLSMVGGLLDDSSVFVEFAPGDCKFVGEVARRVKRAFGVDISDQRDREETFPENFTLIVYDGYVLRGIENDSVDVVFSDQLIEHFHPEDTRLHFELVHRILKPGGRYVFRTPHAQSGPHDVSRYFSSEAECFHLKEWTYVEIRNLLDGVGYSAFETYWRAKGKAFKLPFACFAAGERILGWIPKSRARVPARYLIPTLYGVAIK